MPDPLAPGTLVDRYRVEGIIGQGGMAVVYRVRHQILGQRYALKVMSSVTGALRERVLQEGRVQGALQHRNIVRVVDAFDVDGAPALVMELVDGPCLADVIEEAPLEFRRAERIFRDVVAGVAAAHAQNLIHRDLKPSNVLLQREGDAEVAKVTDFGIVKIMGDADARLTQTGAVFGTPAYMSPEQLEDPKRVDRRTDLFALGSILYEMVAGNPPFLRKTVARTFAAVSAGEYTPVADIRPGVPANLRTVIEACLRGEMSERPDDCAAVLALLDRPAPRVASRPTSRPPLSRPAPAHDRSGEVAAVAGLADAAETGPPLSGRAGAPPAPVETALLSLPPPESQPAAALTFPPGETSEQVAPSPRRAQTGAWVAAGFFGIALLGASALVVVVAVAAAGGRAGWGSSSSPQTDAGSPGVAEPEAAETPPVDPGPSVETPAVEAKTPTAPARTPDVALGDPAPPPKPDTVAVAARPELKADPPEPVARITPTTPVSEPAVTESKSADPKPAEAAAAPAPESPPMGTVWLVGTASSVQLRGAGRTWGAGSVPAGRYSVWADFDGSGLTNAASFTLASGQSIVVKCTAETFECTAKPR